MPSETDDHDFERGQRKQAHAVGVPVAIELLCDEKS